MIWEVGMCVCAGVCVRACACVRVRACACACVFVNCAPPGLAKLHHLEGLSMLLADRRDGRVDLLAAVLQAEIGHDCVKVGRMRIETECRPKEAHIQIH